MDKIRYGIVGFGNQGKTYCDILTGNPATSGTDPFPVPEHAILTAVSTSNPEKATAIQTRYPGVHVFAEWKDLIKSGICDVVIPTVPHFFHHEIAIYAMEHGVSVLSEKPAGIRASDVKKMLDCANAHPEVSFGVFFNHRTNPLYQKIKAAIASGELGNIRRSNWIINSSWRTDAYYHQNPWRGTWAGEGGGVLVNQAPHFLDLWLWLCGTPVEVMSMNLYGAYRDITVDNDVTLVTKYANGATGCFITCTHDPIGTDRLEIDLDKGKVVVEGSKKATIYRLKQSDQEMNATMTTEQAMLLTKGIGGSTWDVETFEMGLPFGFQHSVTLENFALHRLTGSPMLCTGEEGLLSVQLANASQLSSWQKRTVPFPCDEDSFNAELEKRIIEETSR